MSNHNKKLAFRDVSVLISPGLLCGGCYKDNTEKYLCVKAIYYSNGKYNAKIYRTRLAEIYRQMTCSDKAPYSLQ